MTDPKRIAGLLGPTLVVLSASEATNAHIWATVSVTQTYLAGSYGLLRDWRSSGLTIDGRVAGQFS